MTTAERLQYFLTRKPDISSAAFVARDAKIIGDVRLGKDSSVFYGAVLRGDIESIHIGEATNVQDGCIIHLADDLGARVGAWCTIGHAAIIHGAEIGDQCLIGAGALVTQRMKIPPRSMVMGTPAKVVRSLNEAEIVALRQSAEKYKIVAAAHAALQKQSI